MTLLKSLTIVLVLASLWPTAIASALSNPDTGPGCGLGRKLWEGWKGQKQIAPQIFMASTNMTGSYTSSITSGTSGCTNDGTVWDSERVSLYIEINYANLAGDMARGGGEHIASLATLMRVPAQHHAEFFAIAQERYLLVDEREIVPAAIQEALYEAMANHSVLAKLSLNQK